MGFISKITPATQNPQTGHQAEIVAEGVGPWAQSFVVAVKQCIAQRAIKILVDVSAVPESLKETLDPLIKLQQFVTSKGGKVFLKGMPPGFEGEAALKTAGVQPLESAMTVAGPISHSVPSVAGDLEKIIKNYEETNTLPQASDIQQLAQNAKLELESILKDMDRLKYEHQDFSSYLKHLAKHQTVDASKVKELTEMSDKEAEITQRREQIPGLKKQLVEAKTLAETEEKNSKDAIQKMDQENKKKVDTLKKELDNLKANHKKVEADFQKRSDARKAEIAKIEAAKAPKI